MSKSQLGNPSTQSELLFEEYLTIYGYTAWTHEEPIPAKTTTPDYRLRSGGSDFFFEVKEFVEDSLLGDGEGRSYDPYRPLREKINGAVRQFKQYKEFSCSVVMADPYAALVEIDAPEIVLGTMLGNVGFQVPIGERPVADVPPQQVFTKGGKMVDSVRGQPQNTTISAIIILDYYKLLQMRMEIALDKQTKGLGRRLTHEEAAEVMRTVPRGPYDKALRVVVYENPYARIPLSRDLFRGPFDLRWGTSSNLISRVFVGEGLRQIESELELCDRRSPLKRLLDRSRDERSRLGESK